MKKIKRTLLPRIIALVIIFIQLITFPVSAGFVTGDTNNPLFNAAKEMEANFNIAGFTITYVSERCEIWSEKDSLSNSEIEQLAKLIDKGIVKIEEYLGITVKEKYDTNGKVIYFLRPNYVSNALYKPVVMLSQFKNKKAPYIHETVHVIAGENGSRWLFEGLAVYLNDLLGGYPVELNDGRDIYEESKKYFKLENQKTLDLIANSAQLTFTDSDAQNIFYLFSGSFVRYLIENIGINDFMKVYNAENKRQAILDITSIGMLEWKYMWLDALGAPPSINPKPVLSQPAIAAGIRKNLSDAILIRVGKSKAFVSNAVAQIDNSNPGVVPYVNEGRTLVPVRFIAENFGAKVDWEEATETVTVTVGEKVIKLQLGNNVMLIDGKEFILDVPAERTDGRMFIPLRALVETALGKKLSYKNGLIIINKTEVEITDEIIRIYPFN